MTSTSSCCVESTTQASGYVEIVVPGTPVPQGSMRAFVHKHTQRVVMTSDNPKLHDWRTGVTLAAREQWRGNPMLLGAVTLEMMFVLPRPAGHYQPRKLLSLPLAFKNKAPEHMIKRPDLDKLVRALGDALKHTGVYKDDSQIDSFIARKRYVELDEEPFVRVRVYW